MRIAAVAALVTCAPAVARAEPDARWTFAGHAGYATGDRNGVDDGYAGSPLATTGMFCDASAGRILADPRVAVIAELGFQHTGWSDAIESLTYRHYSLAVLMEVRPVRPLSFAFGGGFVVENDVSDDVLQPGTVQTISTWRDGGVVVARVAAEVLSRRRWHVELTAEYRYVQFTTAAAAADPALRETGNSLIAGLGVRFR